MIRIREEVSQKLISFLRINKFILDLIKK